MRRFIEEQSNGKQVIREHYQVIPNATLLQSLPNEVLETVIENRDTQKIMQNLPNAELAASAQSHVIQQELENSLKQQNALLRQILLEKEKIDEKYKENENILETQSLPCHSVTAAVQTQTDCEIAVQTDPWNEEIGLKSCLNRRRTRSENDDSISEDELEYIKFSPSDSPNNIFWVKKMHHRKKSSKSKNTDGMRKSVTVQSIKRKIRTPIQEETEEGNKNTPQIHNRETRASYLRRAKIANDRHKMLQEKLLYDINDSLDEGEIVPNLMTKTQKNIKYYIEDTDGSENEVIFIYFNLLKLHISIDVKKYG